MIPRSNLTLAPACFFSFEITTLSPLRLQYPTLRSAGTNDVCMQVGHPLPDLVKREQVVPSLHLALTFTASTSNLMFRRHQDTGIPYLPWKFVLQYDHPHRYKSLSPLSMSVFALEEPLTIL